ncbi:adenosylmethionine decarboxylase domain-containing protein [Phthorimaea operculella]|nr:adenosylmethionine decarboxylase domain-containing protein [Phthorimaea operculella]
MLHAARRRHSRVHNVFYSRREFARPRAQHHPHHCFDSEVRCIQPAGDTYTHSSMLHAARRRHSRVHNVFYSRREFARPRAQHHPHHCFDSEVRCIQPAGDTYTHSSMLHAARRRHSRVHNVFYSRREFARPRAQHHPHHCFDSEVELLDSFFGDGRAYIMGPENDCWYLYTLLPLEGTVDALEKEQREVNLCESSEPDQTIEILMSDLDPEVMDIFTRANSDTAAQATKVSVICASEGMLQLQTIEILMSDLDPEVMDIFTRANSDTAAQATKRARYSCRPSRSSYPEVMDIFTRANSDTAAQATKLCESSEPDQTIEILMSDLDPEVMDIFTRANSDTAAQATKLCESSEPDQTIEILMSDLDPEVMDIFTRANSDTAAQATKVAGIDKLIPGMVIDDFLFDPCGYSMNGVAKDGSYMTIHITPERSCSYVSFESNVPCASYSALIQRVLQAFRPGKFVLTVFATADSISAAAPQQLSRFESVCGFQQKESQYCRFAGYDLHYALYAKFPS